MLSSTGLNLPTSASGSQPSGNTKKDKIQQTQSRPKFNKLEAYPRNVRTSLNDKKRLNLPASASGSQPSGNTKKDKIQQTQSIPKFNKLEAYPRNVRTSLNDKKSVVNTKDIASVPNSKLNVKSDLQCVTCNGCLFSDNHDSCVLEFINSVNARNACPLTKITTTTKVPLRKPIPLESNTSKPVIVQIVLWYLESSCSKHMTGDRSQLTNFVNKFMGTFKFSNDHVAKIMGYGDYKIRNVTILRVYFVEGLGHNLFSVGQFCDSDLEVSFRRHTCFIRNLKGVDLLTGSQGNNLYTMSLGDMMASSHICLLSKASKTKSWLWHRR
nr:integrase, catalytic region, zinc finger, CCHC-type, peptidase aspartic, catalytic [Tanacetum cinerariifolium]